jgi:hypothetical protein
MQLISGMNLVAYWTSNYLFDLLKVSVTSLLAITLMELFNVHFDYIWIAFIIFPFAIVPFTYVTSYLFDSENFA